MFSGPVEVVADTKIFGRLTSAGTQFLVYEMRYQAAEDNAMILPLPIDQSKGEDALRFIDFSDYEDFFERLDNGFPYVGDGIGCGAPSFDDTLAVFEVGNFIASFVPTLDDFDRLDPQFRLAEKVWHKLPQYQSFGFAVFQLASGQKRPHPMALEFHTALTKTFFPTVHVHDGLVHAKEEFDHAFYLQHAGFDSKVYGYTNSIERDKATGWVRSRYKASDFINRYDGLIANDLLVHRSTLRGKAENVDLIVDIQGDPEVASLNLRPWYSYSPLALVVLFISWFFVRRSRIRRRKRESTQE